jgi:hypothetical protein
MGLVPEATSQGNHCRGWGQTPQTQHTMIGLPRARQNTNGTNPSPDYNRDFILGQPRKHRIQVGPNPHSSSSLTWQHGSSHRGRPRLIARSPVYCDRAQLRFLKQPEPQIKTWNMNSIGVKASTEFKHKALIWTNLPQEPLLWGLLYSVCTHVGTLTCDPPTITHTHTPNTHMHSWNEHAHAQLERTTTCTVTIGTNNHMHTHMHSWNEHAHA